MKKEHIKLLENAKAGDCIAQFQLFAAYASGDITGRPDIKKAFEWGDKAASSGNAEVQFYYYRALDEGGFKDRAIKWLLESAKNGYAKSQGILSFLAYVDKDKENAIHWATEAYRNGEKTHSPFVIALLLMEEQPSDTSDKMKIFNYLQEAANHGNEQAQSILNG